MPKTLTDDCFQVNLHSKSQLYGGRNGGRSGEYADDDYSTCNAGVHGGFSGGVDDD